MIVFDTETTGLVKNKMLPLAQQPKIIEFAAIKLDDATLEERGRMTFFAHPGMPLPEEITKITGITDEMLKDQPPFVANLRPVTSFFLGEEKLVAHNLEYDRTMLSFELARAGKQYQFPWPPTHLCTVELTMDITGKYLKMTQLYEHAFGRPLAQTHRAMDDVEALVEIVKWCRAEGRL